MEGHGHRRQAASGRIQVGPKPGALHDGCRRDTRQIKAHQGAFVKGIGAGGKAHTQVGVAPGVEVLRLL